MDNNLKFWAFIFIGLLMTVGGFQKIINLETIPFESFSYNLGHYCGTYVRAFFGIALVCKGVLNLK
jgi:hypothetical protein